MGAPGSPTPGWAAQQQAGLPVGGVFGVSGSTAFALDPKTQTPDHPSGYEGYEGGVSFGLGGSKAGGVANYFVYTTQPKLNFARPFFPISNAIGNSLGDLVYGQDILGSASIG
jgi:hypothetical protein